MLFTPAIYEHAAKIIGKTPWEVSRSEQLLSEAHLAAYEIYQHAPIVVGIDIYNLEAEAYGAQIAQSAGNEIPAILTPPFQELDQLLALPPFDPSRNGRFAMVFAAAKQIKRKLPHIDVRIPISGPFSIVSNLVGFKALLYGSLISPAMVKSVLEHIVAGQMRLCETCGKYGLAIALFESAATPPLISPDIFENIVLPPLQKLVTQAAAATKATVSCIIGGNTALIAKPLIKTGANYVICPVETDQQEFMKIMASYPEVMVRINMDARVFTTTDRAKLYTEMNRVLPLAKTRKLVCVGTGVLPFEAIPEMVLFAKEYITTQ